jgi:group I intron endonuclease
VVDGEETVISDSMPVIYKITSPTDKVYIGQSWDWTSRKSKYKRLKTHEQVKVHRSLLKYGYDAHKVEVICELPEDVTQEILDNYEIIYWQCYKDCGVEMLNVKEPGSKGKLSEDTRKKMSEASSGVNNAMYGKKGKDHPAYGYVGYWKDVPKEKHPRYGSTGDKNPNFGRIGEKHPMYGLTKGKSPFAKKVINTKTGEVYNSVKDASEILNINYSSLTMSLRKDKNRRGLRYLTEE